MAVVEDQLVVDLMVDLELQGQVVVEQVLHQDQDNHKIIQEMPELLILVVAVVVAVEIIPVVKMVDLVLY